MEWIRRDAPPVRQWSEVTGYQQWEAGQELLLMNDGVLSSMWVPIEGTNVRPRWVGFDPITGRIHLDQLVTRDPRKAWGNPWLLKLGVALTLAEHDVAYAWLIPKENKKEAIEQELGQLQMQAIAELT